MKTTCPDKIDEANVIGYAIVSEQNKHLQKTKHHVSGKLLESAKAMVIAQYEGEDNFYVFGIYGDEWVTGTDTWHQDLEDAINQFDWEYQDLSKSIIWKNKQ